MSDERPLRTGRKTIWRPGADDTPGGEPLADHSLEYTLIWGLQFPYPVMVWGTEAMSDHEILAFVKRSFDKGETQLHFDAVWRLRNFNYSSGEVNYLRIERIPQCPVCHTWSPCPNLMGGK